jgi:hypothetical protein
MHIMGFICINLKHNFHELHHRSDFRIILNCYDEPDLIILQAKSKYDPSKRVKLHLKRF